MAGKSKKKGTSPILVGLITILALSLVTLIIVVFAYFHSAANGSFIPTESYVGSGVINELATQPVSVKINMENCTMTVGTKVNVTATVYPNGSSGGIIWTSSDTNVFTVDANGNINVIGEGIVALTATLGSAYDSIAIECVASGDKSVLNLPDYSAFTNNSGETSSADPNRESAPAGGESTVATREQTTTRSASTTSSSTSGTVATTAAVTQATTRSAATTASATTTATTTAATTRAPRETTTAYQIPTTPAYDGVKVTSTEVAGKLSGYGFTQYLDNTYVYDENDSYKAEVIISSNMTHVYVKERSTGLDSAINSLLTELLPDSHDTIWNTFTSAKVDQTVTVDGRVVRVVVPGDGGHSQIVIYN